MSFGSACSTTNHETLHADKNHWRLRWTPKPEIIMVIWLPAILLLSFANLCTVLRAGCLENRRLHEWCLLLQMQLSDFDFVALIVMLTPDIHMTNTVTCSAYLWG